MVDESSPRYEGWRVAAASGMSVFSGTLIVYTFPILLKPISGEFSWSREAVSSAYSITFAMSALGAVPLGYLVDRLGPRRVVIPCLTLFGAAFASLSALTAHLWHLYAAFGVLGLVVTGVSPVAYVRAISGWFERRRGTALAVIMTGGALGGVVHPLAAATLVQMTGWRLACLIFGGMVIAFGVPIVARFIQERPRPPGEPDAMAPMAGTLVRNALRTRIFWTLVIVLLGSAIAQNSVIVHLAALLTDRGVSTSRAAIAVSALAGAGVSGRLITGWLLDRFFAARVSFVLLSSAALGTSLLAHAQTFGAGTVAAVLIGFGVGGESDVVPYLLSRYFGLLSFSTLYGLMWIVNAAGGAVGPILMGRAFDATGSYEPLLAQIAIASLGIAALMLTLPRYSSPAASHVHSALRT